MFVYLLLWKGCRSGLHGLSYILILQNQNKMVDKFCLLVGQLSKKIKKITGIKDLSDVCVFWQIRWIYRYWISLSLVSPPFYARHNFYWVGLYYLNSLYHTATPYQSPFLNLCMRWIDKFSLEFNCQTWYGYTKGFLIVLCLFCTYTQVGFLFGARSNQSNFVNGWHLLPLTCLFNSTGPVGQFDPNLYTILLRYLNPK